MRSCLWGSLAFLACVGLLLQAGKQLHLDYKEVGRSLGLLDLVLNLCMTSGTEMPEEEALALQGLTSMKNSVPLYWNYKARISRESSVTLQHLYQPEAWCGGLQSFQWFSNQYILPGWESTSVTSEAVWLTELKENRAVVTDFSSREWGQARNEMP